MYIPYSINSLTLPDISASQQKIVNNFAFIFCFYFALFMTFNCELCEKKNPNVLLLIVNVRLLLLLFIRLNMQNAIAINFYDLSFFFMAACITGECPINSHISSYHIVFFFFLERTWDLSAFCIRVCSSLC